jgi:hypothetical protein
MSLWHLRQRTWLSLFPPKKWTYGQISENGVPKFKHGHSWKRSRHLASNFLRSSVSSTTGSSSSSSPSISVSPSSILHWQGDLLKAPSTQPEPNLLSTIVCAENDAARQVLFCVFCTSVWTSMQPCQLQLDLALVLDLLRILIAGWIFQCTQEPQKRFFNVADSDIVSLSGLGSISRVWYTNS